MLKIALAFFLMAHGLVHAGLAAAPNPDGPNSKPGTFFTVVDRSWFLHWLGLTGTAVHWIGITLVTLSTLGFVLTGLGILGVAGLSVIWRTIAIISAGISLSLLIIFWHPWLPVGVLINIVTPTALLFTNWPTAG